MSEMRNDRPGYGDVAATYDPARSFDRIGVRMGAPMNAQWACCGRHDPSRTALVWEGERGEAEVWTFGDLDAASNSAAQALSAMGVQPGDRVAGLLPRTPVLLAAILGVWRLGGVYTPLFTAFGPKAIEHRLAISSAKVVLTDPANREKLDEVEHKAVVAVTHRYGAGPLRADDVDWDAAVAEDRPTLSPVMRSAEDSFLMMFTSGTTGAPKALAVPLKALAAFVAYVDLAIDLREDDVFWNIADPGWAYGVYYAVAGPLAAGRQTLLSAAPFSAAELCRIVETHAVTNLAGSPTAYRLLMAEGEAVAERLRGRLRVVSSAGEPLNPEVIRWFEEAVAAPIYDHYGQTETGMVAANHHGLDHPVRAGSAGYAIPGYGLVVLGEDGEPVEAGLPGLLAIDRPASPMHWFDGYIGAPQEGGRYYVTGDTVVMDGAGVITFVGRADDVITSSGYRIGPFDVESALLEHPDVIEAAVVGKPDPARTEIVKAFVVLRAGVEPDATLTVSLQQHVRRRLSAHAYPREVAFVETLPKTPSGKIQRFVLRQQDRST